MATGLTKLPSKKKKKANLADEIHENAFLRSGNILSFVFFFLFLPVFLTLLLQYCSSEKTNGQFIQGEEARQLFQKKTLFGTLKVFFFPSINI